MSGFIAHLRMNGLRVGPEGDRRRAWRPCRRSKRRMSPTGPAGTCACCWPAMPKIGGGSMTCLTPIGSTLASNGHGNRARTTHVRVQSAKPMIWQARTNRIGQTNTETQGTDQGHHSGYRRRRGGRGDRREADCNPHGQPVAPGFARVDGRGVAETSRSCGNLALARAIRDRRSRQ